MKIIILKQLSIKMYAQNITVLASTELIKRVNWRNMVKNLTEITDIKKDKQY